jgi:hypothetical protein
MKTGNDVVNSSIKSDIYDKISDKEADRHNQAMISDESGED